MNKILAIENDLIKNMDNFPLKPEMINLACKMIKANVVIFPIISMIEWSVDILISDNEYMKSLGAHDFEWLNSFGGNENNICLLTKMVDLEEVVRIYGLIGEKGRLFFCSYALNMVNRYVNMEGEKFEYQVEEKKYYIKGVMIFESFDEKENRFRNIEISEIRRDNNFDRKIKNIIDIDTLENGLIGISNDMMVQDVKSNIPIWDDLDFIEVGIINWFWKFCYNDIVNYINKKRENYSNAIIISNDRMMEGNKETKKEVIRGKSVMKRNGRMMFKTRVVEFDERKDKICRYINRNDSACYIKIKNFLINNDDEIINRKKGIMKTKNNKKILTELNKKSNKDIGKTIHKATNQGWEIGGSEVKVLIVDNEKWKSLCENDRDILDSNNKVIKINKCNNCVKNNMSNNDVDNVSNMLTESQFNDEYGVVEMRLSVPRMRHGNETLRQFEDKPP